MEFFVMLKIVYLILETSVSRKKVLICFFVVIKV